MVPITAVVLLAILVGSGPPTLAHSGRTKVIEAEASYVMADSDTLAGAAEQVLLLAKRKAVEEAGVYIEASWLDVERHVDGTTSHLNRLGIRTIAAAITETEILEQRRWLEGDRPGYYVKIRTTVLLDELEEAIKRQLANEQLAEHHRRLQAENSELKSELTRLRQQLQTEPTRRATPTYKDREQARKLVTRAMRSQALPEKIDLTSQALTADDRYVDAYIIRGQTYLRIASLGVEQNKRRAELTPYIDKAAADFTHALRIEPDSTWALLGQGDTLTWRHQMAQAAQSYEQVLHIDPLFDIARQRLIALHTATARQQVAARQWNQALTTLNKIIEPDVPLSWVAQEKEAFLLRSHAYEALGRSQEALEDLHTLLKVDPNNAHALVHRGRLFRQTRQGHAAKLDFERACALGNAEACAELP